jgi:hypothetical protein
MHGDNPNRDPSSMGYFLTRANPTIASYNASVVNLYNATARLGCFENKNILFYFEKRYSLLQRWRCMYVCM